CPSCTGTVIVSNQLAEHHIEFIMVRHIRVRPKSLFRTWNHQEPFEYGNTRRSFLFPHVLQNIPLVEELVIKIVLKMYIESNWQSKLTA
ncbi:hypothetical protein L9F63_003981, partial [Diploptera punctata]